MISEDDDREWGSKEELPPMGDSTNNSKELPVIDLIVPFCWAKRLR